MAPFELFVLFHTILSIVTIVAGILVLKGLISSAGRQLWTFLFLCSAAITTISGFLFPFHGATPAFVLGLVSIIPISVAMLARYRFKLAGGWRGAYVISAVVTLYFNVFVLIVQAFEKIPALNALAPTQTEPPFMLAQLVALLLFVAAGVVSFKNYSPKKLTDELATSYVSPRPELQ